MRKTILCLLSVSVLALFVCGCATYYAWTSGDQPDEFYTAKTEDDWTLAMYRYRPKGPTSFKTPVILCHGLGMNAYMWDLKKEQSFARYLQDQGFDVWTVDLRGAGRSSKPGWVVLHDLVSGPNIGDTHLENIFRFDHTDWNIDDYALKDVPVIIKEVKRITGSDKVSWVGHSMGGMILFAYLVRTQDTSIQSFAALATPMSMPPPHSELLNILSQHSNLKDLACLINSRMTARSFGVFGSFGGTPLDPVLYNRDNMENEIVTRLLVNAMEDLSPGVLDGFVGMIKTGEFMSRDKTFNYTRALSSVKVPILLVGGRADNLCSIVSLYDTYRAISSSDKTLRIFARCNGYRVDYGHNDLIAGRNAPQEVYPYVARWLKERS